MGREREGGEGKKDSLLERKRREEEENFLAMRRIFLSTSGVWSILDFWEREGERLSHIFATILQFLLARIQFALPPPVPLQDLKFKTPPLLFPEMRKSWFLRFSLFPFPSAGELSPSLPSSSPQKDERRELF